MLSTSFRAAVSLAVGIGLFASAGAARAQTVLARRAEIQHVAVELIADRDRPGPGGEIWLGVKFELEPGWHIYWRNPGDSGDPPRASWQLPAGVKAGDIQWPVPERIDVGGLINYGYHATVVLPVRFTIPGAAGGSAATRVGVSLKWLMCKDMCLPGSANVAIAFPLAMLDRARLPSWKADIDRARAAVPGPAPAAWRATARSAGDRFIVDVVTGERTAEGLFFPLEVSQVDDSAPQTVTPLANGVRFALRKSDQLTKDPSSLNGVVSLPGGRAFVITAPIAPSPGT